MADLFELVKFLDTNLKTSGIQDHSLNGLQVEGKRNISRLAVSVDCGISVIEKAITARADLLLVHHGLIWEKGAPIVSTLKTSLSLLLKYEINLYASHLPLDAHPEWGNNFALARYLDCSELVSALPWKGTLIGCIAQNAQNLSITKMAEKLRSLPGGSQTSLTLAFGPEIPKRICFVSGAGADAIYQANNLGFDTLVTGEPRQFAYHYCKENRLNVIFAGHYATETLGVREVGKVIESQFQVPVEFLDEPTGI